MIWCVEDDADIRDIEIYTLKSTGFEARGFSCGADMFGALAEEKPELLILDIMLPGEDGVGILKKIRANPLTAKIPVIMASAKSSEFDKIHSLDLGADDYLVKPFGMMEMVSRVKAVLRRTSAEAGRRILTNGALSVNTDEHTVSVDGVRVILTYKEFEVLKLLLSNLGKAFSREQLMNAVWGVDYVGESRTVDMHIRTLRQKLGACGEMIETVRNVGYRMGAAE